MSLGPSSVPMKAEDADNFEDIEKQFAVKGLRATHHHGHSHVGRQCH